MVKEIDNWAKLVPELIVRDLDKSLDFWCNIIGFSVAYDRPEEKFAYLNLNGAQIMLEQYNESDREWETAKLEVPFGRGINFQIEVEEMDTIIDKLALANWSLFIPVEVRWYAVNDVEFGQRQFLVKDPDGYLLRLIKDLGERPLIKEI
ncbi:VOC family protein [Flavobacterium branchiarum]|uniref:Bleomycin resistance protein n=1 Tax=Flavobacterium branchiarum TaxID=1114870 RepID=A0ABV5FQL7_9FLAO|nr:VOC family protein [Flavobacterium branchiarum]MDN3672998.1 VOC family protein [Flavobacterium branchiarum]